MTDAKQTPTTEKNPKSAGHKKSSHEWRCDCGRLLFKGAFLIGIIEAKCPRCKRIVYLQEFDSFTTGKDSGMAVIGMDGTILSVNEGLSKGLGYSQEEAIGNPVGLVAPKFSAVLSFWLRKLQSIASSPNPYLISASTFISKDGKEVRLSFFAKLIEMEGRPVVFVVAERGIEAFNRFQEKFRNPEDLKSRPQAIWDFVIDKNGAIIDASSTGVLGYSLNQAKRLNIQDLLKPEALKKEVAAELKTGSLFVLHGEVLDHLNQPQKVELAFSPDPVSRKGERDMTVSVLLSKAKGQTS